jgi:hypothetical protein
VLPQVCHLLSCVGFCGLNPLRLQLDENLPSVQRDAVGVGWVQGAC